MIKFGFILMACAIKFLVGVPAWSQDLKPVLTIYAAEIPGYMGGSRERPGILSEMIDLAAKRLGYKVINKTVPWARALKAVIKEHNTLIPGLSRLPSREKNYTWIVGQMEAKSAFLSLNRKINSYEEAKNISSIGVHRATSHNLELEEKGFTNIRKFNNIEKSIRMMEIGRISAWYGDVNAFSRRWQKYASDKSKKLQYGTPTLIETIWLGGHKNISKQVIDDFSRETKAIIREGTRKKLLLKYFNVE